MDSNTLPTDVNHCHALILALKTEVESKQQTIQQSQQTISEQAVALELKNKLVQEQAHSVLLLKSNNDKLDVKVTELNLKIEKLLQQLFGRKSERRVDGAGQLLLDIGEEATPEVVSALEEAILEAEKIVQDAEDEKKKRRGKRPRNNDRKFPPHLPRIERIVDLSPELSDGLKFIGYDEIETLQWIRPELRVLLTKYAKYAHPVDKTQGISSPERPTGLVDGNRYDASIGVEVVAWKYFYHLPFYRQQDMFAGSGWTPSRSTLQNIETAVEFALRPLAEYLRTYLKFDFTVSRHRDGPDEVLCDFEGNLLGDCWSGFQKIELRSDSRMQFAACWAHARRKIDECRSAFPVQVAKLESLIRMLYDVEDQIRQSSDAERLARRQSLSRHVLNLIDAYLSSDAMSTMVVLPKSNLGIAAAYVRRHWSALTRFVDDTTIPIDSNDCEQLMKRVATGRKNWLFKGSVAAGERAANLMTIIGTAIRNDLDVSAYLLDVLQRALDGETDWASLSPDRWKETHPESIRQYRQEERRQAADRNRTRRATKRAQKK